MKLNIVIDNSCLQLLNIYAPCPVGERAHFFSCLPGYVRTGIPTVVGGDFNTVEDIYLDKVGGDNQPGKIALQALQMFTSLFYLSDIFRFNHPSARMFTWTNGRVSSQILDMLVLLFFLSQIMMLPYLNSPSLIFQTGVEVSGHSTPSFLKIPNLYLRWKNSFYIGNVVR